MFQLRPPALNPHAVSCVSFLLSYALVGTSCVYLPACVPARTTPAAPATADTATANWASPLERAHPLVGRIWDVARARFVEEAVLGEAVRRAAFVAIGEQHDNVDHHRLEARLLGTVAAVRRTAVVFEMIDAGSQASVDGAAVSHPGDADAIGDAVDWSHSGWPAWSMYRPVFAVAASRGLSVIGGGVSRAVAHRIAFAGVAGVEPALVRRFALDAPLDQVTESALRDELREAHCGMLPDSMLGAMALVQRTRDAKLAERLAAQDPEQGAVLVAGNGHVRNDRGVPRLFARATRSNLLAVALLEVSREWTDPAEYATAFAVCTLPFDYVWFTPRASDVDHCSELRPKK
ncbi:MAG TPA: ChaN family lipoprotein [Polyangiaceae bacterium]|jgi:uncharacterized iron-regulated protein|nr:ChaN family lipoprotein [Polyangiaceae bacterium]